MGTVLSLNISTTKGQKKTPVDSVEMSLKGIVGDAHAGDWHRQVSLLADENIDAMRGKGVELRPGDFAENITTRGVDILSWPVGQRFRVGTAVMEMTQVGKECHNDCEIRKKVGDCIMPREGVFARVLEPGTISVGDPIEPVDDRAD